MVQRFIQRMEKLLGVVLCDVIFHGWAGHHDAADLDLPEPLPPQPGTDRQRRCGVPGHRLDPAHLHRSALLWSR